MNDLPQYQAFMVPPSTIIIAGIIAILLTIPGVFAGFQITTYSTNGTYNFTPTTGVNLVMVEAWGGGGGGGGGGSGVSNGGGGGGGGGYARGYFNVTPGQNYTIVVGAGGGGQSGAGAGGGMGGNGTPSYFSNASALYAAGGLGGGGGTDNQKWGAGGTAINGTDAKYGGGNGSQGSSGTAAGGAGGSSGCDVGNGTKGVTGATNTTPLNGRCGMGGAAGASAGAAGTAGTTPGGGGGGGAANTNGVGKPGADGRVIVYSITEPYSAFMLRGILDESTNNSITTGVNYSFVPTGNGTGEVDVYGNINSTIYIIPIPLSEAYNLRVAATNYSFRTYLKVSDGLNTTLNTTSVYLETGTTSVTFTITNQATGVTIRNATFIMYHEINGTFVEVESAYTDVTGVVTFQYKPGERYAFIASKSGYTTKSFTLDPILYSSYTIQLLAGSANPSYFGEDYQNIIVPYTPTTFYANRTNNFTIIFQSNAANLATYYWNLSYPGGSKGGSGTNPSGATYINSFNITGGGLLSTANLTINYSTTQGWNRRFNSTYQIIYGPNNGTFIANSGSTYGMGIIERALIGTIIIAIAAGLISLAVSPIAGLVVGGFLMGLFVYIGFWEWWLAGISFILIFIFVIRRTE